jgi:glucose-1-phosphate cytidylyltransferase
MPGKTACMSIGISAKQAKSLETHQMKAVILAGGFGTRLSEETVVRPKPMIEIGGKPILWHIMKIYSAHGINDFIVCCGYKGHMIKEYFVNYSLHNGDMRVNLRSQKVELLRVDAEPWTVTLVDTGEQTGTGGRLRRVREHIGNEPFCFTYGDGVTDANITDNLAFHRRHGLVATLLAVEPPGRFGSFDLPDTEIHVRWFKEKKRGDVGWVNGGFFILEPKAFDYIRDDSVMWEAEPMETLAASGQLAAYKHAGFWHCMDHMRDKMRLDDLWASGKAPWKVWK